MSKTNKQTKKILPTSMGVLLELVHVTCGHTKKSLKVCQLMPSSHPPALLTFWVRNAH